VAILKQIGRNPLDVNKNVRIGVAFPLDDENMFTGTLTTKEQAKANLLNVLLTYPGERINMPNFGVGLKKLLFETKIDIFGFLLDFPILNVRRIIFFLFLGRFFNSLF